MSDHILYFSQAIGLTDANGRKLSEKDVPRIRPGEVKTFTLNTLDYTFEEGDTLAVTGDTDISSATANRLIGSDASITSTTAAAFTLSTTQDYVDYWDSITNPNGKVALWIQCKVTKEDGRIHKLFFQLFGAPAVDGNAGVVPEETYVTLSEMQQAIAQIPTGGGFLIGIGVPGAGIGSSGDTYLDAAGQIFWQKTLAGWTAKACLKASVVPTVGESTVTPASVISNGVVMELIGVPLVDYGAVWWQETASPQRAVFWVVDAAAFNTENGTSLIDFQWYNWDGDEPVLHPFQVLENVS